MFRDEPEAKEKAVKIAKYLNAEDKTNENNGNDNGKNEIHIHSQRIDIETLRKIGVKTNLLEDNQNLQEQVLTAYHLMTLIFENGPALKFISSSTESRVIVK